MELLSLQQSLSTQLLKKSNISILKTDTWSVPVHSVNITYKPISRTKMDILMKMILQSVANNAFENAEQLSEILLVEQLFIQDLLSKMQKTGLITKVDSHYQQTEKGQKQLQSGVFEEEQDIKTIELLYSPSHHLFLNGDIEEVLEYEDFPEQLYRYHKQEEELSIQNEQVIKEIQAFEQPDLDDNGENLSVTPSIDSIEDIQINDIPCIEFILYDEEQDHFTVRVWNTLIDNWDEKLEQVIFQKEQSTWRENYLQKNN
ncbi:hypothetical protein SFC08_16570 [Lysinibacillus halotolerans]|mgnify:CR=1 FL=1|uniref:Uncharacterized protein n=1 Tax=Lysinibacillus halotolerans TaxID=1368476 RepID=A0A3M8HD67_9BACI|nr:hypothetical protein [Lysinibacillus halotolerans]RND00332.1 hypothetical protein EC501_04805 [Lysinibacillus halotolerans]